MPESGTETQAPATETPATDAPANEPQTLDEWAEANPAPETGGEDLEGDVHQPTATETPKADDETASLGALREQLTQVMASMRQPPQQVHPQQTPQAKPKTDEQPADEWAETTKFLTDPEKGFGYTPEEAHGFTKALAAPLKAIRQQIEAEIAPLKALAAMYEKQQQEQQATRLYEFLAKQPGGSDIYGAADKRNTEAIELTRATAAIIQQMTAARGQTLSDEQAVAQAHKVLNFDKISKVSAKGAVPAIAANRTARLAAQAARGTTNQTKTVPPADDERERFLQKAQNDPLSRKLGFV